MSYILAVETATKVCSVALFQNGTMLHLKEEHGNYSHAENLAVFTQEVLASAKITTTELSAVVVSKGPGSYTGLRIGASFAKGICYSCNIPLIAIDTLNALALGWVEKNPDSTPIIIPMIDARRMEVYSALYSNQLECLEAVAANVIDEHSYLNVLEKKEVYFIGDGAAKCKEAFAINSNANIIEDFTCSARYMTELAELKFNANKFEDVAYFEPFYLKDFVATKPKKLL